MEQILLVYSLPKETTAAIMMLYKNTKVKVHSQDGDTDFFKYPYLVNILWDLTQVQNTCEITSDLKEKHLLLHCVGWQGSVSKSQDQHPDLLCILPILKWQWQGQWPTKQFFSFFFFFSSVRDLLHYYPHVSCYCL